MDHLEKLLDSLSPYELLYVRKRLNEKPLWTGLATFSDLPVEIISEISSYLSLTSYMKCLRVNHTFRNRFTNPHVLSCLANLHFPGMVELAGPEESIEELFNQAAIRRIRRREASAEEHRISWKSDGESDKDKWLYGSPVKDSKSWRFPFPEHQVPPGSKIDYMDGKLIWSPHRSSEYLIDTLDGALARSQNQPTGSRSAAEPGRARISFGRDVLEGAPPPELSLVTSELAIFIQFERPENKHGRFFLRIWHLKEQKMKKVIIPHHPENIHADGENIVLWISTTPYWFHWQRMLVQLPVVPTESIFSFLPNNSRLPPREAGTETFDRFAMSHPTKSNIVFLVWLQQFRSPEKRTENHYHIVKYDEGSPVKYLHKGPIKGTFSSEPTSMAPCPDRHDFESHVSLSHPACERASEYGSYLLLLRGTPNWKPSSSAVDVGVKNTQRGAENRRQGEDGMLWSTCKYAQPGDCDCRRSHVYEWRGTFFNVCTEKFMEYSYELGGATVQKGAGSTPLAWPWLGLFDYSYRRCVSWSNELWLMLDLGSRQDDNLIKFTAKELPVLDVEDGLQLDREETFKFNYHRLWVDQSYVILASAFGLTVLTFDKKRAIVDAHKKSGEPPPRSSPLTR